MKLHKLILLRMKLHKNTQKYIKNWKGKNMKIITLSSYKLQRS